MRLIDETQLDYPPKACAVTNRADGRFVDLQVVIDRPGPTRLYLKTEIVEEAARELGMLPGHEVAALRAQLDQYGAQLADLQDTMNLAAGLEEKLAKEPS